MISRYERWQARARYKQCLDPTIEDIKKLCLSLRRNARDERVLFHYNGHGVPRPTQNGEIWVFNKDFTQYIPLSVYELQRWMGNPAIYVFDCSCSSLLLPLFQSFMDHQEAVLHEQVDRTALSSPTTQESKNDQKTTEQAKQQQQAKIDLEQATAKIRDCIVLCATTAKGTLPTNPDFPADIFTACLTVRFVLLLICCCCLLFAVFAVVFLCK